MSYEDRLTTVEKTQDECIQRIAKCETRVEDTVNKLDKVADKLDIVADKLNIVIGERAGRNRVLDMFIGGTFTALFGLAVYVVTK